MPVEVGTQNGGAVWLDVGSWALFCGSGGRQLVLVDHQPCGPVSARKISRPIPRRLLLDEGRVLRCLESGQPVTELARMGEDEFTTTVRPVLAPDSGTTIGVLAIVTAVGEALPEPPLVGAWEWQIERDEDGMPTAQRRNHWDENLRQLYDVDPTVVRAHEGSWDMGGAMNELISQVDQMRLNSSVRDGLLDGLAGIAGSIQAMTYDIVTGYGSDHQAQRHMRLVGLMVPVEPGDTELVLQGFSYEVPRDYQDLFFAQHSNGGRVDHVLRSVMELAREPMAVVDSSTLDVLTTSSSWREGGFGYVGGLGEVVEGSTQILRNFITGAAADPAGGARSMSLDLCRQDGTVEMVRLTANAVNPAHVGRDVVIRLDRQGV